MTTPSIFISYRIADTLTQAGRLYQSLESHFGQGSTFYDKIGLEPGMKWPKELEERVRGASVVLVLIADILQWLGIIENGDRRTDNPEDPVRREVEIALDEGKLVIPIFFRKVSLPSKNALPASMHGLLECQGHELRVSHWDNDIKPLFDAIGQILKFRKPEKTIDIIQPVYDPLENLALPDPPEYPPPPHPYKGLTWFTEEDARIFFGREEEIAELYKAKLEDPYIRTILFYGPSGAGKSSLLHAGLLPRLRSQGWQPVYQRRTRDGSTAEIIDKYLSDLKQEKPERPLLILDQLEEIYTNPASADEAEQLPDRIRQLLESSQQLRLLLGFREDYLARISHLLKKGGVHYLEQRLGTMSEQGIRRAISAIPSGDLKKYYRNLAFAEGDLTERMARDILSQHEQDVAPLLQFMLRSMWEEVSVKDKAVFSHTLYEKHKRSSILELLDKQLADLSEEFPEEVGNGLVLDLLQHLVTPENTAGARAEQELLDFYRHVREKIVPLCDALKDLHLLDVFADEQNQKHWRLAHDALAPAVLRRFNESDAPGQRARRIVESKKNEVRRNSAGALFSEPDLEIIQAGEKGMPNMSDALRDAIRECAKHYADALQRDIKQRDSIAGFYCNNSKQHIQQLQYLDALIVAASAAPLDSRKDEISKLMMEIAFVQSELGRKDDVLACFHHLQKLTGQDSIKNTILELEALNGVPFRNEAQNILETIDDEYFHKLERRYFPDMVPVKGGTYQIGAEKGENEGHRVTIDNFKIARTQVTWWQYILFCRATNREMPAPPGWGRQGDHPVVNVNWYDAMQYLNWVSERLGYMPAYEITERIDQKNKSNFDKQKWTVTLRKDADGLRLPTEAEWEYAARGGDKSNRTIYAGSENLDDVGWYSANAESKTHPVAEKKANALGLYDMSGNVWEWCWDWYDENYYKNSPEKNPAGPDSGSYRVLRGGSWLRDADYCRVAYRNFSGPVNRDGSVGFRPARTVTL